MASYPERPNLNFDILHKDFDAISSEISKLSIEKAIVGMLKFCIIWPIKLSNQISLPYRFCCC